MSSSANNRTFVIIGLLVIGIIWGVGPFGRAHCQDEKKNYLQNESSGPSGRQPSFGGNSKSGLERDLRTAKSNYEYEIKAANSAQFWADSYTKDGNYSKANTYLTEARNHSAKATSYLSQISELEKKVAETDD